MSTTVPLPTRHGPTARVRVQVVDGGTARTREEHVTTEEPLAIRVVAEGGHHDPVTVSVTMRTPGHDFELAAGFLYGEGVIGGADDLDVIRYCGQAVDEQHYNVVTAFLTAGPRVDLATVTRALPTSSACGVCGTASLDAVRDRCPAPLPEGPRVSAELISSLPERLRPRQRVFDRTGGLHAAGLFDLDGTPLVVREDIGRHNAVDKVVGWALMARRLPLHECVLAISGRAGFEIAQKAVAAGIPVVASVSAPSSLAVDLARDHRLTLAGFVREGRLTVYSGAERLGL